MKTSIFHPLVVGWQSALVASPALASDSYDLRPFHVNLSENVPHMLDLIRQTHLPGAPEYPDIGASAGIGLDVLKSLQEQWLNGFNWDKEQASMNQFKHYTAEIEGLTTHFIHEKSSDPDAIPLLLNHGWPSSFLEFTAVIPELIQKAKTSTGKPISFHIVAPSLPGFAFSSAPPANWTVDDTARVHNTLMTKVLGYKTFAAHGTDWGCGVSYSLYDNFNETTKAAHFSFIPFFPWTPEQLHAHGIKLTSPLEKFQEQRVAEWLKTGLAYFMEQATRPNTIGLSLQDNPVGQLAYMGEKIIDYSDPRAGTGPSLLTHNEIITSVSLYYLTKSFLSSVYIYYQNPNAFMTEYTKANTDAPMLFSSFKYNNGFWPPGLVEKVGNLVLYRNHTFGGHFPALDNPPAWVDDVREIGNYWDQ